MLNLALKAMSFQTKTVMEQRLELVRLANQPGSNISSLSKRFSVSRKVCYKWIKRFAESGIIGLKDKSRKPHYSPNKIKVAVEKKIINLRKKNPEWGGRKLHAILSKNSLVEVPSSSTITAILHRHKLISQEKTDRQVAPQRFEYSSPNELWQMDFKGYFKMLNTGLCHPLTILDDHSRFNICLSACTNQTSQTVKDQLTAIFRRYGLPDKILADNGSPWGTAGHLNAEGQAALSTLAIWLMRLNVRVIHGRPYHPQTQGKEERFHRTLKTELLQYQQFDNLKHCQKGFDKWRNKYNLERPHEALSFKTPSELYVQSKKSFPETLPGIEYNPHDEVRKVDQSGSISYKGKYLKIGKGLKGQLVAIRSTGTEKKEIYYCNQRIKDMIC
jgi:transposase InsO family protein